VRTPSSSPRSSLSVPCLTRPSRAPDRRQLEPAELPVHRSPGVDLIVLRLDPYGFL
jgi:hypothetical protein